MGRALSSPHLSGYDRTLDSPSYDQLVHCMRCGLCLPTCPTYNLLRDEKASPRGRLALMKAVSEGRLEVSQGFVNAMDLCLACLACQSACPAGVPYGSLLECARIQARARIKKGRSRIRTALELWLIGSLLSTPSMIDRLLPLLRRYQATGLQRLNLARLLPGPMGGWERLLPPIPSSSAQAQLGMAVDGVPPIRGRIGLLTGCIENRILPNAPVATAHLLSENGFHVMVPPDQVCCGALPGHIGEVELARQMARRNIEAFERAGIDFVVSDAAGCSAQLKKYGDLLSTDAAFAERARDFAGSARDATELLATLLPLRGAPAQMEIRVAYDEPCHLIHGQGIRDEPRRLLQSIPGLRLVDLPESAWCCGSAGTYNLTHIVESGELLRRKMVNVRRAAPDVLATANTGCILQLAKGVQEAHLNIQVRHVVEILASAYVRQSRGLLLD